MGEQAGDGGAARMVGTQDLPEEDPERDQRGEDPIHPTAQRGQRLCDHVFREGIGERQLAVLEELAAEETHLGAKGTGVRMRHLGSLLAGKGSVGNLHPRKRGSFCLSHFLIEAYGDRCAIRRCDLGIECFDANLLR
jgi:hypothetical protein